MCPHERTRTSSAEDQIPAVTGSAACDVWNDVDFKRTCITSHAASVMNFVHMSTVSRALMCVDVNRMPAHRTSSVRDTERRKVRKVTH